MAIIQDLANEISGYAKTYIKCKIENFEPYDNYGGQWDVNDLGHFNIKLTNEGPLDVKNLRLHLNTFGNYGEIRLLVPGPRGNTTNWTGSTMEAVFRGILKADSSRTFPGLFQFKATDDTNGKEEEVVECHISEYDLSWDNLLYDSTEHEWTTTFKQKALIRSD